MGLIDKARIRITVILSSILLVVSCSHDPGRQYARSNSHFMSKVASRAETEGLAVTIGIPEPRFKGIEFVVSFWDKKSIGQSAMSIAFERNGKKSAVPIVDLHGGRVSDSIWVFGINIPPEFSEQEITVKCGLDRYPDGTTRFESKEPDERVTLILRRD